MTLHTGGVAERLKAPVLKTGTRITQTPMAIGVSDDTGEGACRMLAFEKLAAAWPDLDELTRDAILRVAGID